MDRSLSRVEIAERPVRSPRYLTGLPYLEHVRVIFLAPAFYGVRAPWCPPRIKTLVVVLACGAPWFWLIDGLSTSSSCSATTDFAGQGLPVGTVISDHIRDPRGCSREHFGRLIVAPGLLPCVRHVDRWCRAHPSTQRRVRAAMKSAI